MIQDRYYTFDALEVTAALLERHAEVNKVIDNEMYGGLLDAIHLPFDTSEASAERIEASARRLRDASFDCTNPLIMSKTRQDSCLLHFVKIVDDDEKPVRRIRIFSNQGMPDWDWNYHSCVQVIIYFIRRGCTKFKIICSPDTSVISAHATRLVHDRVRSIIAFDLYRYERAEVGDIDIDVVVTSQLTDQEVGIVYYSDVATDARIQDETGSCTREETQPEVKKKQRRKKEYTNKLA